MNIITLSLSGIILLFTTAYILACLSERKSKKAEKNSNKNFLNDELKINHYHSKKEKLKIPGYYEEYLNSLENKNNSEWKNISYHN